MYDVIVVGGGPGGSTAATMLGRQGRKVLLIDKARFPREKVCGDAISGKGVEILAKLGLLETLQQAESLGSWGILFSGPYGDEVEIPFTAMLDDPQAPGFICQREVFDHILFSEAASSGAVCWEETTVEDLVWEDKQVVGILAKREGRPVEARAPLVIGADGAYSMVARKLGMKQLDERHYVAAVRAYYEGITDFRHHNLVELHFLEEANPGYLWIFPMAGGKANVGTGNLSANIKRNGVKLKPLLDDLVKHPRFEDRFAGARRIGPVRGWGLPLGSKPRKMAGNGWLLVGDAASLIDPFTGEGIGNAMVSGDLAAQTAIEATDIQDFSAAFLRRYERRVLRALKTELRLSHMMQRLANCKWLLNFVIAKAARSPQIVGAISQMFDDIEKRKKLVSPSFFLRVLTAKETK